MPEARYLRKMINGVPVVAAPAEIDITTAEQLGAVLLQAAGAGQPVVVDMTRTRFCDSAGIHAVLRAHERAVADDGEVRESDSRQARHGQRRRADEQRRPEHPAT